MNILLIHVWIVYVFQDQAQPASLRRTSYTTLTIHIQDGQDFGSYYIHQHCMIEQLDPPFECGFHTFTSAKILSEQLPSGVSIDRK